MSDEQKDRHDDTEQADAVEAHGFGQPVDSPHAGATEEPPDVEGHSMGQPVDRPVD